MKTRLLILLLCLSSLSVMGQGIITRNKKPKPKPKQEQTEKKKETSKKETPAKKQQPAAQKKEQSKPVAKEEPKKKTTKPETPTKRPTPEAAGYDVTISCNVPTATLYIDGTANGTASGTRFLKTGSHSVRAAANGYNDYTGSITVNRQNTSFRITMEKKPEPTKPVVTIGTVNGHEWVDLGLPSGTKWATTNVGASSPSNYGNYYAWGETSPKSSYTWINLRYCLDTKGDKFSKYVTDSKYGNVDGKTELDPSDDAAYVNWGSGWRTPSLDQMAELEEKCKWTWTTMSGHNGYKVVGPNGNSLFLPAAGCRNGSELSDVGSYGGYCSRSLCLDGQWRACDLYFDSGGVNTFSSKRSYGHSVRAVLAH